METPRSPRSSERAIIGAALVVVAVAGATLSIEDLATFLSFAAVIAASELFEVTLPNEDRYHLGLAPALGLALLGPIAPVASHPALSSVLIAFAIGMTTAIAIRATTKREPGIVEAASSMLALAAGAAIYHAMRTLDGMPVFDVDKTESATDLSIAGFAAMFITVLVVQTILATMRQVARERVPIAPVFRSVLAGTVALHLSIISVGALLAVSFPALRFWAFPLFLAPLAATQFAFRQFASIRRTYLQTIRALSKVPEMAGYSNEGHSRRVAELSVSIAREMGVAEALTSEIEYAALLHDIGRVSIPDPHHAGSSSNMELAVVGAAIVRETGHFPKVADMIERQYDPYRKRGEGPSETLPLGSKIIKIASAFDDMTRPGPVGESAQDALDKLSVGMAFDFDPEVVQALRRVLEKSGDL